MVQFSQTSWQEYTLANMLETMRYAPMNMTIGNNPVIHYTLPKALEAGEVVRYTVVVGFRKICWTGRISSINNGKILVRLDRGPFRGFNATHEFTDEGNLTACYDEFSFQGFSEFPEETFAKVMANASIVYAVASRKDMRDALLAIESKKQTQGFAAIDQSATAG
jgi:ligand-binding SRPBCC domain-containing protein